MSDSLQSHGLQHISLLCPSLTLSAQTKPLLTKCSLLRLMPIVSVMPSNHLILYRHLLLLPSIFPSIRFFSNQSVIPIRWPKHWKVEAFNFSISHSNEYLGLISFRMNWFDLLAVQGTLKSLLQHYSSKASILLHSTFFIVQLSHPYMTTGKTIALTRQTFVCKVMSLHFNMLSKFVITFLSRSKHLLISWLQSSSAVILEPEKIRHIAFAFQYLGLNFQFSSVTQSCPIFCHPMNCSTPGFPVHHQLPELAQTHVQIDFGFKQLFPVLQNLQDKKIKREEKQQGRHTQICVSINYNSN